jgi:DNA-binding Lrp family transcriptional regulator
MSPERRGRPSDERGLRQLMDFLKEQPGASARAIARALGWKPATVQSRLRQLQQRGRIDRANRVIQPDLWPAYLLLDVPRDRMAAVESALRREDPNARALPVTALNLECNLMVETLVLDLRSVVQLSRRCLTAGAVSARAVQVEAVTESRRRSVRLRRVV